MFTHSSWECAPRRREEQPALCIPVSSKRIHIGGWAARWLITAAMVVISHAAQAHGIVGNRLFPGTLAFDDPAVMDELVLPAVSRLKHPGEGTDVVDSRIEGSFTRLLDDLIPAVFGKPLLESVTHVRPESRERR
jgi:hypothetical protein